MSLMTSLTLVALSPAVKELLQQEQIISQCDGLTTSIIEAAKAADIQPQIATVMALTFHAAAAAAAMARPEGREPIAHLMHTIITDIMSIDVEALAAEHARPEVVH